MKAEIIEKLPVYFTGQKSCLSNPDWFNAIWDCMCDNLPGNGHWWTMGEAQEILEREMGYKPKTSRAYISAVMAYVRAESGTEVLQRAGNRYRFT